MTMLSDLTVVDYLAYAPSGVPFDAVAFAIIVLVLILRPQGIAGIVQSERA